DVLQVLGASLLAAETCEQAWHRGHGQLVGEHLATLRQTLEQGVTRLRHLMSDLRPYLPEYGGLEGALQNAFRSYVERSRSTITFAQTADPPLDNTGEALAYRLIVESLLTVQRLDEPNEIHIELRGVGDHLDLEMSFTPQG